MTGNSRKGTACVPYMFPLGLVNSALWGSGVCNSAQRGVGMASLEEQTLGRGIHFPCLGVVLGHRFEEGERGTYLEKKHSKWKELQRVLRQT